MIFCSLSEILLRSEDAQRSPMPGSGKSLISKVVWVMD